MISEVRNGYETGYDDGIRKIRKAAAAAIKELSHFRSAGRVLQEPLDSEVARIGQEKLQPYGCDLVVHRMDDGQTRFLIKVQTTGRRYDLIKNFFHRDDESAPRMGVGCLLAQLTRGPQPLASFLRKSGIK